MTDDLYGRGAHLTTLSDLVAGPPSRGGSLVLHGSPGSGKSALLGAAHTLATTRGLETLSLFGSPARPFPFAAARTALAVLGAPPSPPDYGHALLAALAARPVLLLVDDAHLLDVPSREALVRAGSRLATTPAVLIMAMQRPAPALPSLAVGPLTDEDATALLDARAPGLPPTRRERALTAAAGNPRALLDLALAPSPLPSL